MAKPGRGGQSSSRTETRSGFRIAPVYKAFHFIRVYKVSDFIRGNRKREFSRSRQQDHPNGGDRSDTVWDRQKIPKWRKRVSIRAEIIRMYSSQRTVFLFLQLFTLRWREMIRHRSMKIVETVSLIRETCAFQRKYKVFGTKNEQSHFHKLVNTKQLA
jgi:hypothetical protein